MKYLTAGPVAPGVFLRVMTEVLKIMRERWPKTRAGFCFTLYGRPNFYLVLKGRIGKVQDLKIDKYHDFAEEKAIRLVRSGDAYYSSYQTRNPDLEKYGGAIRGGNYILSVSGLALEHEDEAVVMVTLVLCKQMDEVFANDLAEVTENKIFGQLLNDCRSTNYSDD